MLAKSKIKCGVWGDQNKLLFETSTDPSGRLIGKKIELINEPEKEVDSSIESFDFQFSNYFPGSTHHQRRIFDF